MRSAPGLEQLIWRRLPAILLWGTLLPPGLAGLNRALSAFAALRASGAVDALESRALERLNDFRIELCVRGRRVGRAGAGARASRLARALTKMPLEINLLALAKAGLTAF